MKDLEVALDLSYEAYLVHKNRIFLIKQIKGLLPELSVNSIKIYLDGYLYGRSINEEIGQCDHDGTECTPDSNCGEYEAKS